MWELRRLWQHRRAKRLIGTHAGLGALGSILAIWAFTAHFGILASFQDVPCSPEPPGRDFVENSTDVDHHIVVLRGNHEGHGHKVVACVSDSNTIVDATLYFGEGGVYDDFKDSEYQPITSQCCDECGVPQLPLCVVGATFDYTARMCEAYGYRMCSLEETHIQSIASCLLHHPLHWSGEPCTPGVEIQLPEDWYLLPHDGGAVEGAGPHRGVVAFFRAGAVLAVLLHIAMPCGMLFVIYKGLRSRDASSLQCACVCDGVATVFVFAQFVCSIVLLALAAKGHWGHKGSGRGYMAGGPAACFDNYESMGYTSLEECEEAFLDEIFPLLLFSAVVSAVATIGYVLSAIDAQTLHVLLRRTLPVGHVVPSHVNTARLTAVVVGAPVLVAMPSQSRGAFLPPADVRASVCTAPTRDAAPRDQGSKTP